MPGLVSACSCCNSGIPPAASRPSAAALAPFPRGATVGFPSLSSLPPSGAYQTRVSDLSKSSQYRSWSIIYQIAILDKRTPVDIMVELVVVITAKLRAHIPTSDHIVQVPFVTVAFSYAYLGIKLFLRNDLGHVRVESNLHIVMSARIIHQPRAGMDPANLFLGDRIHERLDTLEKGVDPPSDKITYMYNVMISIARSFGFSCRGKLTAC
jgi:hypothetical protein